MFKIITLFVLALINLVAAQVSGFWWLDPNFATFGELKAPAVKFEEGDDNGTDDTDKIVFANDDLESGVALNIDNSIKDRNGDSLVFDFPALDSNDKKETNKTVNFTNVDEIKQDNNNSRYKDFRISKSAKFNSSEDVNKSDSEIMVFPSENNNRNTSFNHYSKCNKRNKSKTLKESDVEHICDFISKSACLIKQGTVEEIFTGKDRKVPTKNDIICCVLPVTIKSNEKAIASLSSQIRFPRSVIDTANKGQIQRETLLKKIIRPIPTTVGIKKIVNDYDYVDPYWNIKNSNIKAPVKVANTRRPTPYDVYYDTVESEEDYASELPKPGLLGVYGQVTRRPVDYSWVDKRPVQTFNAYGFNTGYHNYFSTIDPRLDDRASLLTVKTKPLVSSSEEMYDAEGHIVTYQANPDFQVLQDFKLLNLIKNKTGVHNRIPRKTTTVKVFDYDRFEAGPTRPSYGGVVTSSEVIYDEVNDDDDRQLYERCGQRTVDYDNSDENVEIGTHPWLALVVRARRQHSTLCSAVIIHPRAAITAASCVQGSATGDIVVRAGEWDLTEIRNSQQRLASIYVHPLFEAGVLNHDLAILHWKRPLRLNKAVQPVCLGDSEVGEKCTFVGWSGSDQNIRARPRVQHATVIKRKTCLEHLNNAGLLRNMPNGAFCATAETTGCVSGIGSSLLCQHDGRVSAIGVTVWRNRCDQTPIMMLPIKEWAKQAFKKIGI